jgi:hypothetical protein
MQAAQQFQAAGMQNIMGAAKGAYQLQSEGIDLFNPKSAEQVTPQETQKVGSLLTSLEGQSSLTTRNLFGMLEGRPSFGQGFNTNMSFSSKNPEQGVFIP